MKYVAVMNMEGCSVILPRPHKCHSPIQSTNNYLRAINVSCVCVCILCVCMYQHVSV